MFSNVKGRSPEKILKILTPASGWFFSHTQLLTVPSPDASSSRASNSQQMRQPTIDWGSLSISQPDDTPSITTSNNKNSCCSSNDDVSVTRMAFTCRLTLRPGDAPKKQQKNKPKIERPGASSQVQERFFVLSEKPRKTLRPGAVCQETSPFARSQPSVDRFLEGRGALFSV